jgi:hypothetical protein
MIVMIFKKYWCLLLGMVSLTGCELSSSPPDVSNIPIRWEVQRFERDLFQVDTLQIDKALDRLAARYPGFTQDFLYNILGSRPEQVAKDLPGFMKSYKEWYQQIPSDRQLEPQFQLVKEGCAYFNYYFPAYILPKRLITFIGPVNSFGNILTNDALAVGLQVYMGKDYGWFGSTEGQQLYPPYISRRFEPAYLPVNCMKNLIDDLYPDQSQAQPLVEQMIESGKRVFLLQALLPKVADTLITGYTGAQLRACYASEQGIWSFFVQNDLLFSKDITQVRDYLGDAPGTPALGDGAPGNIGQFCGWQIVKKWMKNNKETTMVDLMKTPASKIFQEAKYKP